MMTQPKLNAIPDLLRPFGFSEIEALAYGFLLREGPATGYRISHGIGKPTANTYKALRSLAERGALIVEDTRTRLCRAMPPEELLASLERQFQSQKEAAVEQLSQLGRPEGDERVYQLETVAQTLERARLMLARAREIVLLDIFPMPLAALKDDLEAAARRGVRVAIQCYEAIDIPGVWAVRSELPPALRKAWPGQQLSLVVDAQEHLLALFSKDGKHIHQAIWSENLWLSCMQHNHVACELMLTAQDARQPERLRTAFRRISLLRAAPPGLKALKNRFKD